MKSFTLSFTGLLVGAIIIASLALTYFAQAQSTGLFPIQATTSATVEVGPDTNVQVLASSTRSSAYFTREDHVAAVYCNANGDVQASATAASFKLSTTSGETYQITGDNPYDGAVRCYASASTTLLVSEYDRR